MKLIFVQLPYCCNGLRSFVPFPSVAVLVNVCSLRHKSPSKRKGRSRQV
jgi:hypothetical protein